MIFLNFFVLSRKVQAVLNFCSQVDAVVRDRQRPTDRAVWDGWFTEEGGGEPGPELARQSGL